MAASASGIKLVYLYSSVPANASVDALQRRVKAILDAKGFAYDDVDGANADNKERRSELWAVSEKRAVYPQLFAVDAGSIKFIGDGEEIESLNEAGGLEERLAGAAKKEAGSD